MNFNKQLIHLVSQEEAFYNASVRSMKSKEEMSELWKEVAVKLNANVVTCQRRWRTLRTAFGKQHKRMVLGQSSPSSPGCSSRHWAYYKQLSFLAKQIRHRDGDPRFEDDFAESPSSSGHNSDTPPSPINILMHADEPVDVKTDFVGNETNGTVLRMPPPTLLSPAFSSRTSRSFEKRRSSISGCENRPTVSSNHRPIPLLSSPNDTLQRMMEYKSQELDRLDHFGMFVAAQLKTKPRELVETYMKKISDVIFTDFLVEVTIAEQSSP